MEAAAVLMLLVVVWNNKTTRQARQSGLGMEINITHGDQDNDSELGLFPMHENTRQAYGFE